MKWVNARPRANGPWQNVAVSEPGGQLVIRRRWQPLALGLGLYESVVGLPLWGPWAMSGWHHLLGQPSVLQLCFLGAMLVGGPFVAARRFWSRGRVYVFDRPHDYVTCDGQVVCALSEVQSVRLGEPVGWGTERKALGFLIHGRNEVLVAWEDPLGLGGEELGQAGFALSVYARVPLWAEGVLRNPTDPEDVPPSVVAADPTRQVRVRPRGRAPE